MIDSEWGLDSTELAYLLLNQQPRVQIPVFPKKFRGNIINFAEVHQWCWLEESGQKLENDDRTHLVLTSGKPELQKRTNKKFF